ncbi:MAG: FHA domain-containing protein [Clostridia bacterium]|nr:FHA domain-containing protein [Clostridia bacterium]
MTVLIIIIAILLVALLIFLSLALRGRIIRSPVNFKRIIKGAELWTVTVSKYGYEDSIMDEFYLYTLDFVYGDREQKKAYNIKTAAYTRQNVGSNKHCKIQFDGKGVSPVHGFIRFEQDWGLTYTDNTMTKTSFFRKAMPKVEGVHRACKIAPYGVDGYQPVKFISITDNLKLFIGDCVLLFKKSYIDDSKEVVEDGYVENFEDGSENDELSYFDSFVNGFKKGLDKSALWCYNEIVCMRKAFSRWKTSLCGKRGEKDDN